MYMYTEIDSSRAPPNIIITQYINLEKGTARNEEQIRPIPFLPPIDEAIDGPWPLCGTHRMSIPGPKATHLYINIPRNTATIEPTSDKRVKVFFQKLMLGPLKVDFKVSAPMIARVQ